MKLRYEDDSGVYRTGVRTQEYEYSFYDNHPEYFYPIKAYSALFEADGKTLASSVLIAPVDAADVEDQIGGLGEDPTAETVNQTASLYAGLSAEEQERVPLDSIRTLDGLVESRNNLTVTKTLPQGAGITVDGLALASGVAQDTSVQETALTVKNVTDTAQAGVAEALLELDFAMTVNGQAAQPAVPVVVSVACTEAMKANAEKGTLRGVHLTEDGTQEDVEYTLSEDNNTLTFRAASFSGYAVVGDPANAPVDSLTFLSAYRVQTPQNVTGECTLIVAAYDADGRMTQVYRYSGVAENQIHLLTWDAEPAQCRAFLLDGQGRPQTAAARWPGTDA